MSIELRQHAATNGAARSVATSFLNSYQDIFHCSSSAKLSTTAFLRFLLLVNSIAQNLVLKFKGFFSTEEPTGFNVNNLMKLALLPFDMVETLQEEVLLTERA